MSWIVPKKPAPRPQADLRETGTPAGDLEAARPHALDLARSAEEGAGFFRFRYTVTEVSLRDGRAQVQGRRVDFSDGRLRTETFEGELAPQAFVEAVRETQERMLAQCAALMNPWSWLLPARKPPRDAER
jgi:hypothetical protein